MTLKMTALSKVSSTRSKKLRLWGSGWRGLLFPSSNIFPISWTHKIEQTSPSKEIVRPWVAWGRCKLCWGRGGRGRSNWAEFSSWLTVSTLLCGQEPLPWAMRTSWTITNNWFFPKVLGALTSLDYRISYHNCYESPVSHSPVSMNW